MFLAPKFVYILCTYLCVSVLAPEAHIVQLTAKFTTHVVFSHVLFEAPVNTHEPHSSEPIAHVGLVHTNLGCS